MRSMGVISCSMIENSDPPKMKIMMRGDNFINLHNYLENRMENTLIFKINFCRDPSTKESVLKCQAI